MEKKEYEKGHLISKAARRFNKHRRFKIKEGFLLKKSWYRKACNSCKFYNPECQMGYVAFILIKGRKQYLIEKR